MWRFFFNFFNKKDYIKKIQEDPVKSKFCKVKILCRSLAENLVHLITITNPSNSESENANKKGKLKLDQTNLKNRTSSLIRPKSYKRNAIFLSFFMAKKLGLKVEILLEKSQNLS